MYNRLTSLLGIKYPIIQAGMVWNSGWKLASAVSNAGGLGLIGAGSMTPDLLNEHIIKCGKATKKPFGVNLPLMYSKVEQQIQVIIQNKVPIVFTSAGNPAIWTQTLKNEGIIVAHVISSVKFALKAQDCGIDLLVAEGFEAGGHNGREETTTMVLVPLIKKISSVPLIAAGGIGSGEAMLAAFSLGADGVQVGSRFAACHESSSHIKFKQKIIDLHDGHTVLTLKELAPVRMIKNEFYRDLEKVYSKGADTKQLKHLLGKGRAKRGMFEGDLDQGELEIGQVSAQFESIQPAEKIVNQLIRDFNHALMRIQPIE